MVGTNKQGQALGRKGAESRTRLLDAARTLIETTTADKLSVSAIARAAGLASQTFYLYFRDVDEILLWLSREATADAADVIAAVSSPWAPADIDAHTDRFVSAFYRFWDRNRAILNIRNFRADSGQEAFLEARNDSAMPIVRGLARQIHAAGTGDSLTERDALARAVIIVSAIERMASRYASLQVDPTVLTSDDLKRAEGDILRLMLSSRVS